MKWAKHSFLAELQRGRIVPPAGSLRGEPTACIRQPVVQA